MTKNKNTDIEISYSNRGKIPGIVLPTIVFLLISLTGWSQTVTSDGNWDDSSIWSSGNIGDGISENVTFNNNLPNTGIVTIRNGYTYTIGNLNMNQGNELTVVSGGTLNIGSSGTGNERDLTTGNTSTINIDGDLTIYGDLNMGNTLTLNITGTLTIIGDLIGGNNASLTVNGEMSVTNITVKNSSTISGTGTINISGTCSDGGSNFCGEGPLPVELLYFKANISHPYVMLDWATASEKNNDYFTLERSVDGLKFIDISTIQGNGTTNEPYNYSYTDTDPSFGIVYYRLSQTDFDGTQEFFEIISAHPSGYQNSQLRVYPNPIRETPFKIIATGLKPGEKANVNIVNSVGKEVYIDNYFINSSGSISIEISNFTGMDSGFYVVHVNQNSLSITQKFIVL